MKLNSREIVKGRGGTNGVTRHPMPCQPLEGTVGPSEQRAMSLPAGSYLSLSRASITGLVDAGHAKILGPAQLVLIYGSRFEGRFSKSEVGIWWRRIQGQPKRLAAHHLVPVASASANLGSSGHFAGVAL